MNHAFILLFALLGCLALAQAAAPGSSPDPFCSLFARGLKTCGVRKTLVVQCLLDTLSPNPASRTIDAALLRDVWQQSAALQAGIRTAATTIAPNNGPIDVDACTFLVSCDLVTQASLVCYSVMQHPEWVAADVAQEQEAEPTEAPPQPTQAVEDQAQSTPTDAAQEPTQPEPTQASDAPEPESESTAAPDVPEAEPESTTAPNVPEPLPAPTEPAPQPEQPTA